MLMAHLHGLYTEKKKLELTNGSQRKATKEKAIVTGVNLSPQSGAPRKKIF